VQRRERQPTGRDRRVSVFAFSLPILLALTLISVPARARQSSGTDTGQVVALAGPEIGRVVAETVKKLSKTELHKALTTPLAGCLATPQLCNELDIVLRKELKRSIQGTEFIEREEAMKYLAAHGFMDIDAYMGALDDVASHAGADVVIGEDFDGGPKRCRLRTTIVDAKHHYALADSNTTIRCAAIQGKTRLSVLKDPVTGVSLIAALPVPPDAASVASEIRYPSCLRCPEPRYSSFARERGIQGSVHILLTVNQEGTAQDLRILGGVEESLERVSYEAVRTWTFKPAVDGNGKAFAARIEVEVTFQMAP
jgi:TonB family protein